MEQWGTPQEAGVLGAWRATPTTQQHQRCPQDTPQRSPLPALTFSAPMRTDLASTRGSRARLSPDLGG